MIVRTPNRHRYTIISKVPLEDSRLSWKARGLLSYLLSKPDNWTVIVSHLIKEAPDGRDGVTAGLKELERLGYIKRTKRLNSGNRFDGMDTEVFEEPTVTGFSVTGNSVTGKSVTNEEGLLKNNNNNEMNRANENDLDLSRERPDTPKNAYSEDFEVLWKLYPRKTNKQGTYKKFLATMSKVSDVEYPTILASVIAYAESREGEEEKYTLHGATFFGPDERWRDWVVEPKSDSEREFDAICAVIYDQWDSEMMWVNPDTHEDCYQNPSTGGYIRPRGPNEAFVASDGTLYKFDPSNRRVAF